MVFYSEFFILVLLFSVSYFACSLFLKPKLQGYKSDFCLYSFALFWQLISHQGGVWQWIAVFLGFLIPLFMFQGHLALKIGVYAGIVSVLLGFHSITLWILTEAVGVKANQLPVGYTASQIAEIFVLLFFYLMLTFWKEYKSKPRVWKQNPYLLGSSTMVLLVMLTIFFLLFYYRYYPVVSETPVTIVNAELKDKILSIILTFILVIATIIFELYKDAVNHLEKALLEAMNLRVYRMQDELYRSTEDNLRKLTELRHDFKNHLTVAQEYLQREDYTLAREYLKTVSGYVQTPEDVVITKNRIISAILTIKQSTCHNKNIQFKYHIDCGTIHITDMDMSTLLSNILDNAIEAAEQCPEGHREIWLEFLQEKQYLMLFCGNTCIRPPRRSGNNFLTSKEEAPLHGIGIYSINTVIEKYNGELKTSCENSIFELEAILTDPQK